jgi:hypothetical protein
MPQLAKALSLAGDKLKTLRLLAQVIPDTEQRDYRYLTAVAHRLRVSITSERQAIDPPSTV